MSFGKRTSQAQEFASGAFIVAGQHVFRVKRLIYKEDGRKGATFIAELVVVKSTTMTPGLICSYVEVYSKEGADGRAKSFCKAVLMSIQAELEEDPKAVDAWETSGELGSKLDELVSPDNPAADMLIHCNAWEGQNKAKTVTVVNKRWSHEPFESAAA